MQPQTTMLLPIKFAHCREQQTAKNSVNSSFIIEANYQVKLGSYTPPSACGPTFWYIFIRRLQLYTKIPSCDRLSIFIPNTKTSVFGSLSDLQQGKQTIMFTEVNSIHEVSIQQLHYWIKEQELHQISSVILWHARSISLKMSFISIHHNYTKKNCNVSLKNVRQVYIWITLLDIITEVIEFGSYIIATHNYRI
jgi:hypothetical protein